MITNCEDLNARNRKPKKEKSTDMLNIKRKLFSFAWCSIQIISTVYTVIQALTYSVTQKWKDISGYCN